LKFRDSGMPDERTWGGFFDPAAVLGRMGVADSRTALLDVGCGYGTFLIPASRIVKGRAVGVDIDPRMVETCRAKIDDLGIRNADLVRGDVSDAGTIALLKERGAFDYAALFNILHCERPASLIGSVLDLLEDGGRVGVIHWVQGDTPRGPPLAIRPKPETIVGWMERAGSELEKRVDLPPYHFGLVFRKR